jgi:hypothetical protein
MHIHCNLDESIGCKLTQIMNTCKKSDHMLSITYSLIVKKNKFFFLVIQIYVPTCLIILFPYKESFWPIMEIYFLNLCRYG